jgi:hypothetical protein
MLKANDIITFTIGDNLNQGNERLITAKIVTILSPEAVSIIDTRGDRYSISVNLPGLKKVA